MDLNTNKSIDPNKFYSVRYLSLNKIFPWLTSHYSLTAYLNTEKGRELLKPVIRETNKHVKYYVKGETILEVLALLNQGTLTF